MGRDARAVWTVIADTTEAQFDALVDVHFKDVFFLTQTMLPLIADGGRIVNLSSGLTRFAAPGFASYAAAKGAVEVLSFRSHGRSSAAFSALPEALLTAVRSITPETAGNARAERASDATVSDCTGLNRTRQIPQNCALPGDSSAG